uniref:Uncharacterized protein n=1 Tax=Arundo donax TaxID=35708 RepID=A0A0A9CJG2_ARUDO
MCYYMTNRHNLKTSSRALPKQHTLLNENKLGVRTVIQIDKWRS